MIISSRCRHHARLEGVLPEGHGHDGRGGDGADREESDCPGHRVGRDHPPGVALTLHRRYTKLFGVHHVSNSTELSPPPPLATSTRLPYNHNSNNHMTFVSFYYAHDGCVCARVFACLCVCVCGARVRAHPHYLIHVYCSTYRLALLAIRR